MKRVWPALFLALAGANGAFIIISAVFKPEMVFFHVLGAAIAVIGYIGTFKED